MLLFTRFLKAYTLKEGKNGKNKKAIAIVGLDNAGKTTIVNRLLKSEYKMIRPTFGINIEVYKYRSLEFVVYDLGGQTPLRENLWKKFVKNSDGIIFVLDSADKERFELAVQEFKNTLSYNLKAPILFLSNKIDLEDVANIEDIMKAFNFGGLLRHQRKYYFARCSALTGESLFESWDWLTLQLANKQKELSVNPKILGGYIYLTDGSKIESFILGSPKTQSKYFNLFRMGEYEIEKFIRQMDPYPNAETLLQVEQKQLIIMKEKNFVLGVIIEDNDPIARVITILKNICDRIEKKNINNEKFNMEKILEENYPLDIFVEK